MALSRLGCTPVFSKGFHSTIGFGIDGGAGAGPSDEAGGGEGIAARGKPLISIMFAFIITTGRVSRSKNVGFFPSKEEQWAQRILQKIHIQQP